MKKKLKKALHFTLLFMIVAICAPFWEVGRVIFWISKLLRALALLMMGCTHSAKEEITDWDILLNIKDVIK